METISTPVMLYTEQTPNPETLKFVTNKMLYRGTADFRILEDAVNWSPLAVALFDFPYVKSVYINNNFVTITKEMNYNWEDIMLPLKDFVKKYVQEGHTIINEGYEEAKEALQAQQQELTFSGDEGIIAQKIKGLIDEHIKPAVAMDGGNIEFKSYDKGVVTVIMQGACSGCPSSTVTLKSGIEGLLKRMVPEVTDVISEIG